MATVKLPACVCRMCNCGTHHCPAHAPKSRNGVQLSYANQPAGTFVSTHKLDFQPHGSTRTPACVPANQRHANGGHFDGRPLRCHPFQAGGRQPRGGLLALAWLHPFPRFGPNAACHLALIARLSPFLSCPCVHHEDETTNKHDYTPKTAVVTRPVSGVARACGVAACSPSAPLKRLAAKVASAVHVASAADPIFFVSGVFFVFLF